MGFFGDVLNALTFPFRKLIGGLKFLAENLGKFGEALVEGVEVFVVFAVDNFPEEFIMLALEKVLELELQDISNEDKREEFIQWAIDTATELGIEWSENMIRALLEILVARVKGSDDGAKKQLADVRFERIRRNA